MFLYAYLHMLSRMTLWGRWRWCLSKAAVGKPCLAFHFPFSTIKRESEKTAQTLVNTTSIKKKKITLTQIESMRFKNLFGIIKLRIIGNYSKVTYVSKDSKHSTYWNKWSFQSLVAFPILSVMNQNRHLTNGYRYLFHKRLYYLMMHTENIQISAWVTVHAAKPPSLYNKWVKCLCKKNIWRFNKKIYLQEKKGKEAITAFKKQLIFVQEWRVYSCIERQYDHKQWKQRTKKTLQIDI